MSDLKNEMMDVYIDDMKEYLAILNGSIIMLEKYPDEKAAINEMFRAYHTMKSSTAAMEFKGTADFIHRMEDLLYEIREGRLKVNPGIIKILFESYDCLECFLNNVINGGNEGEPRYEGIIAAVASYIDTENTADIDISNDKFLIKPEELEKAEIEASNGRQIYRISIVIDKECLFRSVRAWMVFEDISRIAAIIASEPVKPQADDFKNGSFIYDDTEIRLVVASDTLIDEFMQELCNSLSEIDRIKIEEIKPGFSGETVFEQLQTKPGELRIFKKGSDGSIDDMVDEIIEGGDIKPEIRIAIKENGADVKDVVSAFHVQENMKTQSPNQSYIRVPANKIDNMVDCLGELLITQSLYKREIGNILEKDGGNLQNSIVRMERIAKELQNITMSLRMVSLKQTFQKIYRIGRDTAADLGKEVKIEIYGDETEIDRNVVDKIHDPLMHIIRNSISHGIESREERISKGKSGQARVILQACNKRGIVYIEISDDGKGLAVDSIYKKALDKDLVDNTKKYSDEEIMKFIFLPGFSTAEKIDSISGRGVGLNVVQTEIAKLGGKVDIENRPGNGCSFILKIPVNLATINGTVVEISGSNYVIPTLNIRQMLKPQEDQWVRIKGKTTGLLFRNEIIPIIPIDSILHTKLSSDELRSALVVVVEHEQKLMALPVRSIIGKQEVVVKQIGSDFSKLSYLSGATILGDGRVSLILDVETLYKFTDDTVKA